MSEHITQLRRRMIEDMTAAVCRPRPKPLTSPQSRSSAKTMAVRPGHLGVEDVRTYQVSSGRERYHVGLAQRCELLGRSSKPTCADDRLLRSRNVVVMYLQFRRAGRYRTTLSSLRWWSAIRPKIVRV
jgi:hypothetical protein